MSFPLRQRYITCKIDDSRWGGGGGGVVAFSPTYEKFFEFVPDSVSFVVLKDMHDVFNAVSTVSRSGSYVPCPYFFMIIPV